MTSVSCAGMTRIRQRKDFLAAARSVSAAMPGLVLQARSRQDEEAPRVGFTATRKIGNAVTRNRVKRRLRALAEICLKPAAAPGYDYVIIGRGMTAGRSFVDLQEDLRRALARVHGTGKPTRGSARSDGSDFTGPIGPEV